MELYLGKVVSEIDFESLFEYFDKALSEKLLAEHVVNESLVVKRFISYLSAASRQGHLCVKIGENLDPSPSSLFKCGLTKDQVRILESQLKEGAPKIPEALIEDVNQYSLQVTKPLCRNENTYYFQRNWCYETVILNEWNRLKNCSPSLKLNASGVFDFLESSCLNAQQRKAVNSMATQSLTCLTGGPGTGKTFTAAFFIEIFLKTIESVKKSIDEIVIILSAPTGKATQRLFESVQKKCEKLQLVPKTLHGLIRGFQPQRALKYDANLSLNGDLFLIDEASMIDAALMAQLLSSIPQGSRVVLLGDPYQLPAIENGSLFADLVQREEREENHSVVIRLEEGIRIGNDQIKKFAQLLKEPSVDISRQPKSNSSDCLGILQEKTEHFSCLLIEKHEEWRDILLKRVERSFYWDAEMLINTEEGIQKIFDFYKKQVLLTPLRKGLWGVEGLNSFIQKRIKNKTDTRKTLALIQPILITVNCERESLTNGDIGLLVEVENRAESYGLFYSIEGASKFRKIPLPLLPSYEFAYALSIHKSQGSEYDHVDLLIPQGAEVFAREIFYTAVTRAKKSLSLIAHPETFKILLEKNEKRISGLLDR